MAGQQYTGHQASAPLDSRQLPPYVSEVTMTQSTDDSGGFYPPENRYHLTFADTQYTGLKVSMTGLSVRETLDTMTIDTGSLDISQLIKAAEAGDTEQIAQVMPGFVNAIAELRAKTQQTYEVFARHLVSWNVRDRETREPVPETFEGVASQDIAFIKDIITAWRTGITGVSDDLKAPSRNGEPSAALSIPMEPLSPNPQN